MATKTVSKNIASLIQAVNTIFAGLIEEMAAQASKGKIKVDDIKQAIEDGKFQEKLTEIINENMPKTARKSKEKKLKDPNAPKRPKSSYLFFCDDKRAEIKEANPDLKAAEITVKLGSLWKELSDNKKAKYTKKAEEAKAEYTTAMESYERPSDEELADLDVNKPRRGSKGEGKGKGKGKGKKKDPNAPKRPMSSYLFFSQDKRDDVKEANPDMKGPEIAKELGRMWKEDFADENSRKKWVKKAKKDKERYDEEMKSYTPPASDEKENDEVPKPKRGRPKKSTTKKSDDEEESEEAPKAKGKSKEETKPKSKEESKPKSKAKGKSKSKDDDADAEEQAPKPEPKTKSKGKVAKQDEEEPKPKAAKTKAKVEMTMGAAKVVATPAKGKIAKEVDAPISDEDLFGDDE